MKWIQENVQTYYDVYKCSNCGAAIMVNESGFYRVTVKIANRSVKIDV